MATQKISLRQCIAELSSKNIDYKYPEQVITQAESLKSLSNDLYTDNIRFIYELIQNADDAEAINVTLSILDDAYLIIAHDGKPFDEKDLQGLCGVNNGTKKKDLHKTGYKGLGFKAVFGKSDKVIIYSNGEYFRFDSSYQIQWNDQWDTNDQQTWERENDRQFISPWQINPIWTDENEVPPVIRNFLNSREKQIHVANIILLNNVEEIHLAIDQLKQQTYMFLFLRNISKMTFVAQSIDTISIARDLNYGLKKVYLNKNISQWIIKRFELDVPDDVRDKLTEDSKAPEKLRSIKKVEIFFAAKYKDPVLDQDGTVRNTGGIEKLRDQDSILFSYLPTKILEYKFPVLINANFLTNANREQIHTDSAWNQWLFEKIGSEIFQWIKELVIDGKFRFQAYRLIPSRLNLANNILSKRFNESFETTVKNCGFILNRENQLLKVNEVIMDSTSISEQTSFIDVNSIRQYIIDSYKNSDFQCADNPFIDHDPNLSRVGVRQFTWQNCIEMFKSDIFLQSHSIEQNKRMIEYFYTKCSNLGTTSELGFQIEQIPFLMDQNNRLQLIKNIYFPAETIGESGTIDSDDLFVNKTIFNWLNEKKQKEIKQWLEKLGVIERTDLTYLCKTIIPNASTYVTSENAIKTINMLFMLFQKNTITKKELDQLKKLKLLTTRKTLIPAEECFFCDEYKSRLQLEEYLKTKADRFLSFDYVSSHNSRKENDNSDEWRRFFIMLGVQDELRTMEFPQKLTISDATKYEFCDKYLSRISPNGNHMVHAFSGLITIPFMQHTKNNYDFAKFFWSYVMKSIKIETLMQNMRIYWGHSDKRGAINGTLSDDADYISWFVKNINCIPTTIGTCELSSSIFTDNKELKELCGKYMFFSSIPLLQDKVNWQRIFNFKTKLSGNDYFDLLAKIRLDETNLKDNLDRIQVIYFHILKEMYYWSSDEQNAMKARTNSLYLLTESNQWKLASGLHLYIEGDGTNNGLNDTFPCLKLDYRNKNHPHLDIFLDLLNIKQIRINDLKLVEKQSLPAEEFRRKLIEISPFLKKWLKSSSSSFDMISSIDGKIQQEYDFIESDCLQLFYKSKFAHETNVYFDNTDKKLYVTRPWHSETAFIDLPNKLCQLLNIQGFEKNIRFLLKGTVEEIEKHFITNSIEIPTDKDIVTLEVLSTSDVLKQPTSSVTSLPESNKSASPVQNTETSIEKHENTIETTKKFVVDSKTQKYNTYTLPDLQQPYISVPYHYQSPSSGPIQEPIQEMTSPMANWNRPLTSVYIEPEGEQLCDIELIDISSITTSNSVIFENISNGTEEREALDLNTGRIGEKIVYEHLIKKYCHPPNSVFITWENENGESHLPYDILLKINEKIHYIEVKSTRTYNQHTFPLSIKQIEAFLQHRKNYYIYRVYIDENKLMILNNIRQRLIEKQQLECFLTIKPLSFDQTLSTDD